MALRLSLACAASFSLCAAMGMGQRTAAPAPVPLLQPGAPGQPTKTLSEPTVGTALREPTEADIKFFQGMLMHHGQAVEMTGLMATRTRNPQLLELGQRISISQTDEMVFMKRWLGYHGKPLAEENGMAGMEHMDMPMPTMPGMLTLKQMDALRKATGPEFDHLFLTGMVQHHTGALTMVKDLFNTPGAGQDTQLFDFTADVEVTQQGEIDTMQSMLAKEKH
jgi:uncharacterized protein (DUF305 family)